MKKKSIAKLLLVLGIFLELSMISFWKAKPTWFVSPLLWLLGGCITVAAGAYVLLFSKHENYNPVNENIVTMPQDNYFSSAKIMMHEQLN